MSSENPKKRVLSGWPVAVALGLVTLLIIGMLGLDVHFSQQEASKTTDIIENAQHSIILLNEIRSHARQFATTDSERESTHSAAVIAAASRSYDPMASYQGEREEWNHLQDLLRQLLASPRGREQSASLVEEIDRSIDKLVAINTGAGVGNLKAIRAAHRQALWSDVLVGGIALAIVVLISVWLLRVLTRQRRLIVERVQFLREKNSELEAFAGRAAHDLRSPMNPIRGYTDLILESPGLPEDVAGMVLRIRRAVDRMANVVDNMLALSVSGRPPSGLSSSALVIEKTIEEMGPELRGVDLVTKFRAGRVACAEGVLSQILRNLIGNAIKFRAPSRPLRITVETCDVGPMVEIAVEDNGVGIDPESARHAFEPFYRGPIDRELPGHGLGLAIVDRTTRALGGTCELSSVLDHSTRIVVRLPKA